ncbi:hypothetical protein LVJ94_34205 [Pendulispora rubella]|uniref:Uncharacterized protein n=1 Tax=Pendulispora rubella TaxID=2741070 RepID=A0ABZ2KTF9_9BACT
MATWAGAIVETCGQRDFASITAKYGVTVTGDVTPRLLIEGDLRITRGLGPPIFAEALSRDLQGTVIAFFVQTGASVAQIEHWEKGELVRKLEHWEAEDRAGWGTQTGTPQVWEASYFFDDGEGTADDARWPSNLRDELTDDEMARYEHARAMKDASSILDLLSDGSPRSIRRLCLHFGVDPDTPGARYTPPPSWRLRIVVAAVAALFVGAILAAALSR